MQDGGECGSAQPQVMLGSGAEKDIQHRLGVQHEGVFLSQAIV